MFRSIRALLLTAMSLLSVHAQTESGIVSGIVTDPSGAVVANAGVKLHNPANGQEYQTVTNSGGAFALAAVLPGTYNLTVTAPGFTTALRTGLVVNIQARIQADVALRVGEVADSVQVSADAPLLQSQSSSVGQVVENRAVVTLPLNGRNYSQLALLMPGATPNPG